MKGRIIKYDDQRGFGFIIGQDESEAFFHISDVKSVNPPIRDAIVEYELITKDRGLAATNIHVHQNLTQFSDGMKPELRTVVLVSCSSRQREGRWKASQLYNSSSFRESLECAKALSDDVYILSSKHGLIDLETEIEDYDVSFADKSSTELDTWGKLVAKQVEECDIDVNSTKFIILAYKDYYNPLIKHFPNYDLPLRGVRIQNKSAKLRELRKKAR